MHVFLYCRHNNLYKQLSTAITFAFNSAHLTCIWTASCWYGETASTFLHQFSFSDCLPCQT